MRLLSVGVPCFGIFRFVFLLPASFFWMCNLLDAPLLDATCCVLVMCNRGYIVGCDLLCTQNPVSESSLESFLEKFIDLLSYAVLSPSS